MHIRNKIFILVIFLSGVFIFAKAADAATYYVSTSGSDSNSCATAQSIGTPKRTLRNAVGCLTAGSTLLIRAGSYPEELAVNIPSGTSWSNPVTLKAYPGETVTLNPRGTTRVLHFQNRQQYIIIDGLILDGAGIGNDVVKITYGSDRATVAHHIRIMNSEVKNGPPAGQGILCCAGGNGNEFINLKVHDNSGNDYGHGIYLSETSNSLIENSDIYRNAGWGIHAFGGAPSNNIIRNNRVHDNARVGNRGPGIGIYGPNNLVYNNIIWNNAIGINFGLGGGDNNKVYNNTIFNNRGAAIENGDGRGNIFKNNIFYQNGGTISGGSGTIQDHNLTANPQFVNAAGFDFRLQAGSPAINAGVAISEVTTDITGASRPVGGAYDIGAYEYGGTGGGGITPTPTPTPSPTPTPTASTTPTPSGGLKGDLNNDKIVNSLDWSLMNAKWFTSDSTADLNSDGIVNSLDFSIMNGNWLKSG